MIRGARYVHTNLIARDWRVLTSFYESVFGCERVPPQRDYSGPEVAALTSVPGAALRGVHLRLPGLRENGPTLEIFEYSPVEPGLAPAVNRPGFAHIAFVVDSVEDARREVLTAGGTAVGEIAVFTTATGARVAACYVTDPEGNIIELQSWDEDAGDGQAQTEAASQPELIDGRHGPRDASVGAGRQAGKVHSGEGTT